MNDHIVYQIQDNLPRVTLANIVDIRPPYVHFKRQPCEYILYYMISGEMAINQGDTEYTLRENEYIILDPRLVHVGRKSTVGRFLYIHFKGTLIDRNESFESCANILPAYRKISSRDTHVKLLAQADEVINAMRKNTSLAQSFANVGLFKILLLLSMDYTYSKRLLSIDVKGKIRDVIPRIISYLETDYNTEITGEILEDKFNFHFDYMNRQFSKWTGKTIFNYLTDVRIDQARQLLSTGYYSTKEVAGMTGFKDVSYFSKVFKKETGTTPGKWT